MNCNILCKPYHTLLKGYQLERSFCENERIKKGIIRGMGRPHIFARWGIRAQFVILITLLLISMVGVLVAVTANRLADSLLEEHIVQGNSLLHSWASICHERVLTGNSSLDLGMYDFIDAAQKNERGILQISLIDSTGRVLVDNNLHARDQILHDSLYIQMHQATVSGWITTNFEGVPAIWFFAPLHHGTTDLGLARIAVSLESIESGVHKMVVHLVTIALFILLIGLILTTLLVHRITRPIQLLTSAVREFGDHFDPTIPDSATMEVQFSSHTELGELRDAFNEMTSTLHRTLQEKAQFRRQATTDSLTGLMNKRQFQDDFPEILRNAREHNYPLTFLMLDMDRFKALNDTMGHSWGDVALKALASAIMSKARDRDRAYRLGGDEFGILLVGVGESIAEQLAKRIEESYEQSKFVGNETSISFGIVVYDGLSSPEEFLHATDLEMYRVKRAKGHSAPRVE